ncbi:MAG: S9 family peptidase [Planctomycetes bacterium]|nr:S9 family peptidase [Planctomycetota bacterium]
MLPNKTLRLSLVSILAAAPVAAQSVPRRAISFDDVMGRKVRFAVPTPAAKWDAEGKLLRVRSAGPSTEKVAVRIRDPRTWDVVEPNPAEAAAKEADESVDVGIDPRTGQVMLKRPGKPPVAITEDPAPKREAHLSPTGTQVSYTRGNNLVVQDLASSDEWAVTSDGSPEMFHGVLDWVYQEEIYGRYDFQGHWWSPTGAYVAFLSLDESPVREFTVIDHVPSPKIGDDRGVVAEISNYPKAGDPNPVASFHIANLANRSVTPVDLSSYPQDLLVVRVGWNPSGDRAVVQIQDRIQTWLELCYADPATGKLERLIREESPTWVDVHGQPQWLADGSFLWWSDRTGYRHLYHYGADGKLIAQVTRGNFPVREILRLDEASGLVWFEASDEYPSDQQVFRVRLDGTEQVRLTEGRGTHQVELDHDGGMFVDEYSNVSTPPVVRICDRDGGVLRTLESGPMQSAYDYCPQEIHVVEARDGFPLDATLIKPLGFDESGGPYPIWIDTYSGPAAPSVRNAWRVSSWHQFLAHQGIAILQVNVRTASNAGHVVVGKLYKQFCVQEMKDLEDTIRWVLAERWADPDRVGITGWSYGGTMTAYALTHSKLFRLGIAGAGVYDWQLYDTIYTERYMDTPQSNPKGYDAASCISAAKDLHGYLVLIHGTMDDNVHLQNTIRFADELQKAGKDFEMMLYPNSRHGVRSPHLQALRWKIIRRELLGS